MSPFRGPPANFRSAGVILLFLLPIAPIRVHQPIQVRSLLRPKSKALPVEGYIS